MHRLPRNLQADSSVGLGTTIDSEQRAEAFKELLERQPLACTSVVQPALDHWKRTEVAGAQVTLEEAQRRARNTLASSLEALRMATRSS